MKKICIFLNGSFVSASFLVRFKNTLSSHFFEIPKGDILYCADGGFDHFLDVGFSREELKTQFLFSEKYWIGDLDSLNLGNKQSLFQDAHEFQKIILNKDKDFSDFACILDNIQKCFYKAGPLFIEIFAGLGGRRDHEAINIQEAQNFMKSLNTECVIIFHDGIILSNVSFEVIGLKQKFFSILGQKYPTSLSVQGALYDGPVTLSRPSHGLSNFGSKEVVSFEVSNKEIISVYLS